MRLPADRLEGILCGLAQVVASVAFGGDAWSQASQAVAPQAVIAAAPSVTFESLAAAPIGASYVAERVRRFLGEQGQMIEVAERLKVQGDGTVGSPFRLDFVDLVGSSASPSERIRWSETYRNNAGLLHLHGGFSVHDAAAAARNYRIFDFGHARRLGRPVRRVVVFPNRLDKGIWVIDVDEQSGIPIYTSEYDSSIRLLNELETTSFAIQPSTLARNAAGPQQPPTWSWVPQLTISPFATFAAAAASIPEIPVVLPSIDAIVSDYHVSFIHVTEDPVNGDRTLVLGYTDGIDEFFVLQGFGGPNPFQGSPATHGDLTHQQGHAIASYDDPWMRAYVFREGPVTFQVLGSGSLTRLQDVALRLCQQVVTGH